MTKEIAFLICCCIATYLVKGQVKYYAIEHNHSTIGFKIPIAGGLTLVSGKFTNFDLELSLVDNDWTKSSAKFIIQTKSIDTGIKDRDDHLCSADFFDAEQFPEIIFETKKIKIVSENNYIATGNLTMHGITQSIDLPFKITGTMPDNEYTIGIALHTIINRKDFGIGNTFQHSLIPDFIGQEVNIEINFWTKKDKRKS